MNSTAFHDANRRQLHKQLPSGINPKLVTGYDSESILVTDKSGKTSERVAEITLAYAGSLDEKRHIALDEGMIVKDWRTATSGQTLAKHCCSGNIKVITLSVAQRLVEAAIKDSQVFFGWGIAKDLKSLGLEFEAVTATYNPVIDLSIHPLLNSLFQARPNPTNPPAVALSAAAYHFFGWILQQLPKGEYLCDGRWEERSIFYDGAFAFDAVLVTSHLCAADAISTLLIGVLLLPHLDLPVDAAHRHHLHHVPTPATRLSQNPKGCFKIQTDPSTHLGKVLQQGKTAFPSIIIIGLLPGLEYLERLLDSLKKLSGFVKLLSSKKRLQLFGSDDFVSSVQRKLLHIIDDSTLFYRHAQSFLVNQGDINPTDLGPFEVALSQQGDALLQHHLQHNPSTPIASPPSKRTRHTTAETSASEYGVVAVTTTASFRPPWCGTSVVHPPDSGDAISNTTPVRKYKLESAKDREHRIQRQIKEGGRIIVSASLSPQPFYPGWNASHPRDVGPSALTQYIHPSRSTIKYQAAPPLPYQSLEIASSDSYLFADTPSPPKYPASGSAPSHIPNPIAALTASAINPAQPPQKKTKGPPPKTSAILRAASNAATLSASSPILFPGPPRTQIEIDNAKISAASAYPYPLPSNPNKTASTPSTSNQAQPARAKRSSSLISRGRSVTPPPTKLVDAPTPAPARAHSHTKTTASAGILRPNASSFTPALLTGIPEISFPSGSGYKVSSLSRSSSTHESITADLRSLSINRDAYIMQTFPIYRFTPGSWFALASQQGQDWEEMLPSDKVIFAWSVIANNRYLAEEAVISLGVEVLDRTKLSSGLGEADMRDARHYCKEYVRCLST